MGGADKALLKLAGKTLLERALERAEPQVGELLINANGDLSRFTVFHKVIADSIAGFLGPLAGILSGLDWVRSNRHSARWLASFACDCPFFPRDMVQKLIASAEDSRAKIAVAASGKRHHPVFAVWSADLPASSEGVLQEGGLRKMDDFVALFPNIRVPFAIGRVDPFFNINTQADLAEAEALMAARTSIR
jgi:molybdenum cofactor guanylyltransferase